MPLPLQLLRGPAANTQASGFALLSSTQALGPNPVTPGINTAGARLIVVTASQHNAGSAGALSDSRGNTWVSVDGGTIVAGTSLWLWYCINPSVGSGHTFSIANSFTSVRVQAFSGPATTSYQSKTSATNLSTSLAPGSITPSANRALVVSSAAYSAANNSFGVTGGFIVTSNQSFEAGVNWGGSMAYLLQNTAAAVNPAWTLDPSQSGAVVQAVFLP